MNTQLVYPMTAFRGFADNSAWMQNNLYMPYSEPQQMTKDDVFGIANTQRTNLVPIFADESKYLPTSTVAGDAGATVVVNPAPTQLAAAAPSAQPQPQSQTTTSDTLTKNQKEMYIVDGIIIAVGIVLLAKIIS